MKRVLLPLALAAITSSAFADQVVVTSVDCQPASLQNLVSNYTSEWKLKNSKDEFWTVKNFNNNNGGWDGFIRTGSSKIAVVGSITTDFVIEEPVNQIIVDVYRQKTGTNDIINKAAIYVADNLEFTNAAEYVFTDLITADKYQNAVSVAITSPKENQYYKVEFDCNQGTNNGFVQVAGITYYAQDGTTDPDLLPAELSYDWTEFSAVVGEDFKAPTLINPHNLIVSYTSSNEDVATVDEKTGAVTIKNPGLTTITAAFEGNAVYAAGSASYVIAVNGATGDVQLICSFKPVKENMVESVNAYTETWTVKDGDNAWTVAYFNNNNKGWDYVRAGNKGADYTPYIATDFAVPGTLESVRVDMTLRSGGTPSAATVYVSDDAEFSDAAAYSFTDQLESGVVEVKISVPKENQYVKVEFVCPKGSSNGYLQINGIDYCGVASATTLLPSGLSYEETEFNVMLGDEFAAPKLNNPNGLKVTYTSSDETVATVAEDGEVTILAAGSTVITAASEANETFSAGSARYTLNVMDVAENLAQFIEKAPAKGDRMVMKGAVTVVYVNGSNVYIKDDSASSLIYGKDLGLNKGDVLPGGWTGVVDIYNGLYEIKPEGTLPEVSETTNVVYPVVTKASELVMNEVVTLSKVTFDEMTPSEKVSFSGLMDNEIVTFYNTFTVEGVAPGCYDVLGAVAVYKDNIQVYPLEYTKNVDDSVAEIEAAGEDAAYYTLQGVRVAVPANGLFIRVAGGKASKVVVE